MDRDTTTKTRALGLLAVAARVAALAALLVCGVVACSSKDGSSTPTTDAGTDDECAPDDKDGVIGGAANFDVTVTDSAFSIQVLTAQNSSTVTLKLTNAGTTPHGFSVDCLAVAPIATGCPATSCFPAAATLAPLAPGASQTIEFEAPYREGVYTFRSPSSTDGGADTPAAGQFVLN